MLEKVKKMDSENKNKIIYEYNRVIGLLKELLPISDNKL